jgi:uncharacterized protein (TIGR00369 family)
MSLMQTSKPQDPNFKTRVQTSFARQKMMQTINARLTSVDPGVVEIELPFQKNLTQQHGFLHAGVVATIGDNACGYAALSLAPADTTVLTIEYKLNLLAPATGEKLIARGRVIRDGRTITVCAGDVFALSDGNKEKIIASMLSTIMILRNRNDLVD